MKKIFVSIASLVFGSAAMAAPAKPASMPATPKKPSAKTAAPATGVLTAKQPVYTLRLNSNPTTGYSWFLVKYPKSLLTVVGHKYVPPTSELVGASGSEVWTFKATQAALAVPQVIKVQMMYARPWEINSKTAQTVQTFYAVTK